jgi:hypothetical protein
MGKTYRKDAKNDGWRRAKLDRERQKSGGRPPNREDEFEQKEKFSPFDLPPEEHESFA